MKHILSFEAKRTSKSIFKENEKYKLRMTQTLWPLTAWKLKLLIEIKDNARQMKQLLKFVNSLCH